MAEFQEVMRDWRRMCKTQEDSTDIDETCETCPLKPGCTAIYDGDMDYAHVESVVTQWAAEHPEPKYPTWLQWLFEMGVMIADHSPICNTTYWYVVDDKKVNQPIPADIAQKLGIEPKNGQCEA